MNKVKFVAVVLLAFAGISLAVWTYDYDKTTPPDIGESYGLGAYRIRELKLALQERLNVDHYFDMNGNEVDSDSAGMHRYVTFYGPNTTPLTIPAGQGRLYTKDVNGIPELHFIDQNEQETQITSNGVLRLTGGILSNDTWLLSRNAAGTGTEGLIKLNTNNKAVLPDYAQIEDANNDPCENNQLTSKKYVDAKIANAQFFGAWTSLDSTSNALVQDANYLTTSNGFVTAIGTNAFGFTDSSNPPTTKRVGTSTALGYDGWIMMPVRKGDYWRVENASTIYWLPIGSGECVKQP